jgi:hypothetical protein
MLDFEKAGTSDGAATDETHRCRSYCIPIASSIARPDSECGSLLVNTVVGVQVATGMPATDTVRVSAAREAVHGCMPLCECGAQAMEPLGRGQAAAKGIIETRVTTANK